MTFPGITVFKPHAACVPVELDFSPARRRDRQTDRVRDRERQTDREGERERQRETVTDTETEKERETERERLEFISDRASCTQYVMFSVKKNCVLLFRLLISPARRRERERQTDRQTDRQS